MPQSGTLNVTNRSFNLFHENKILEKISEFTVISQIRLSDNQ